MVVVVLEVPRAFLGFAHNDTLSDNIETPCNTALIHDFRARLIHFSFEQVTKLPLEIVATSAEEVAIFDVTDQATGDYFFVEQWVQLTQNLFLIENSLLIVILVKVFD